ncbi:acetyltransferase [Pontibacter ruber]|uniref:Acetyltransferase n=1 Tax=Pontibacter ruber TaxID=1343895 RepID=A0ABW5D4B6_9BACT|nr:acetyltransferase [Pontibacter ruber]
MKDIAIAGAGGLGREVLVLLHQINEVTPQWNILGFYDDDPALQQTQINGFPCLGSLTDLSQVNRELHVAVAVGYPAVKKQLVTSLQHNSCLFFPALVHPSAQPKPYQYIELAEGTLVFQGAVLTTNIRLGKHVLVYLNCTVGHDAVLENFVSLMPGVNLGGNTNLGEGAFLGANATVLQGLQIGSHTKIGAGSVVSNSIPDNCTAVGVPAKIIKHHDV